MKNWIVLVALVFAGSVSFAGVQGSSKNLTVDKAMTCFVKALKPEAFTAAWMNGGQKTFLKKVKGNENMPVLGDQLADLVAKYMSDAAFSPGFLSIKDEWLKQAATANTDKTVARALWDLRQNVAPDMMTEKGADMLAKYDGQMRALAM